MNYKIPLKTIYDNNDSDDLDDGDVNSHKVLSNETLCAIWYHFYNLKNEKNPLRSDNFSKIAG